MKIVQIPIRLIEANPDQPRKSFTEEEIGELKESISQYGVLQPLLVRRERCNRFSLIAGERRLRAAALAGLSKVPVIIKDMGERESSVVSLVENLQRQDLNFIEEARAYKRLMEEYGLTQLEIAKKVSKKQSTVSNKIRVLSLPDDVLELLLSAKLTERHGRALLRLETPEERRTIAGKAAANSLNVRQTEKLIDNFLAAKESSERRKRVTGYISYKIYVNTIKKAFKQVQDVQKRAKIKETESDDSFEILITIPKNDRCFT